MSVLWLVVAPPQPGPGPGNASADDKENKKDEIPAAEQKPKPQANESKDDFMKRCIPMLIDEGKDNDQAVAICNSLWEEKTVSNPELLEEIKLLKAENLEKDKKILDLRYKVLELSDKDKPKTLSEMTDDEIL